MKDNITDWALRSYQNTYQDNSITKEDIFYYIYGMLHHSGYRAKYQSSLVRGIPHIPTAPDFYKFSAAGRKLAGLHLNFDSEGAPRYNLGEPINPIPDQPKKIRFARKLNLGPGPKTTFDFSTLIIDDVVVYDSLPEPRYKVNGRTPLQWFADRYGFSRNKASGNTNWPLRNTSGSGVRAIMERLAYVGVGSDEIIDGLPSEFEMDDAVQAPVGLDRY